MGPFKCPDCGVWWAGYEHRCQMVMPGSLPLPGTVSPLIGTYVRCTCPPNRGQLYQGACPVHDVQITYTTTTYGPTLS